MRLKSYTNLLYNKVWKEGEVNTSGQVSLLVKLKVIIQSILEYYFSTSDLVA